MALWKDNGALISWNVFNDLIKVLVWDCL